MSELGEVGEGIEDIIREDIRRRVELRDDVFAKFVTVKKIGPARFEAKCAKGLFGATASTKEEVTKEALHYFMQYYADGEYEKGEKSI